MKYVVITGTSTGIGYATVKYLIEHDYFVFGSVRKQTDAERLLSDFGDQYFQPLLFDVTDEKAITEMVEVVRLKLGGETLAGLINNAGIAVAGPLTDIAPENMRSQFEVNVFGVLNVVRSFLPLLKSKNGKPSGRIINISSIAGMITSPFTALYSASKYALEAISDGLRRELFIYNIEVIDILPGPIDTPIWDRAKQWKDAYSHTDYAPYFNNINKKLDQSRRQSIKPVRVAKAIYRGLSKNQPKTRYIVVKNAWLIKLVSRLPDRWVDAILVWQLKRLVTN